MTEHKIRKAYELLDKRWTLADVVELLSLSYNQLRVITYGKLRQAHPYQLIDVIHKVDNGMSFSEIEALVDKALAGIPKRPVQPHPQYKQYKP